MTRRVGLGRLFDGPWPQDPRLDPYREGVFELRAAPGGEVVGHLLTGVARMRGLAFWIRQEQLWCEVVWADGARTNPHDDYGPRWVVLAELECGEYTVHDGPEPVTYRARPLTGPERDAIRRDLAGDG